MKSVNTEIEGTIWEWSENVMMAQEQPGYPSWLDQVMALLDEAVGDYEID